MLSGQDIKKSLYTVTKNTNRKTKPSIYHRCSQIQKSKHFTSYRTKHTGQASLKAKRILQQLHKMSNISHVTLSRGSVCIQSLNSNLSLNVENYLLTVLYYYLLVKGIRLLYHCGTINRLRPIVYGFQAKVCHVTQVLCA